MALGEANIVRQILLYPRESSGKLSTCRALRELLREVVIKIFCFKKKKKKKKDFSLVRTRQVTAELLDQP